MKHSNDYARGFAKLNERKVSGPGGALALLKAAAEEEHPDALALLGTMYAYGMGVRRDLRRAFDYDRRAALAGSPTGTFHMARALLFGEGVASDVAAARRWLAKAIALGNADALDLLAYCYRNGVGVRRNLRKAFSLSREAAAKGLASAMYSVGVCFSQGLGVPADLSIGRSWFRKAARAGDAEATELLRRYPGPGFRQSPQKARGPALPAMSRATPVVAKRYR